MPSLHMLRTVMQQPQRQGAQRPPSRTSLSFLLLVVNAAETLLCRTCLTPPLPEHSTFGRRHKPRFPTTSPCANVTAGGLVTVSVQSKPSKEDRNFCSLKRCRAAFLDHVQYLQFLTHHRVLLGFIQAAEVISLTSLPYGLFKMLRN